MKKTKYMKKHIVNYTQIGYEKCTEDISNIFRTIGRLQAVL